MRFDLRETLRSLKPQKYKGTLERRFDGELIWVDDEPIIGGPLFLDTTVYLDVLKGRSPVTVDTLLTYRLCHHSAVCLSELTHVFGRLDPKHPSTRTVLETVQATIDDIPEHRLHAPNAAIWGQAGVLAGLLFRMSNLPKGEGLERKFINDALVFLQARQLGASVLTGNIRDFDFLSQLVPTGRIILYRS
ncbi:type II toxin-antitoxin system VapC family toxin [Rhizobium sp. P40RR-XXII]|uniref:type II toxin-antitoxin system VapC family toxin n=1 Tax=unclassified Rhizobium TaxID=2613769 RepID=UPI00145684D8|nr:MULTISPECIES: type II toxin-antitoxin system VapC family toxin [unclassified Rhizobium]NLR86060.1 type II toxin-antitoxin system VapC family toxin [Rhizobium sp. P28RR-XV]NLS18785.1 type II toxin-antitoxin system VapC family toxin [Rhizobium sp. P40RR-XXII]